MAELLPKGTPVSQALAADEDIKGMVRSVLHAVDAVHGDGGLPLIPVQYSMSASGEHTEAVYYYDSSLAVAIAIRVAYDAETSELFFLHELAHFIDHQGLGYHLYSATGSSFEAMTQAAFASESNPVFSEWREAVAVSEAIGRLQEVSQYRSATVPLADGTREAVDIDQAYVAYLLEPRELFARSYAQYIVTNSRSRILQGQLDSQRQEPLAHLYPLYWEDEDFLPIFRGDRLSLTAKRVAEMTDLDINGVELSMKSLGQTDEERVEALMRLGLSRRRSLFIVKMRDREAKGDAVDVSIKEHQKDKVA